MNKDKDEKKGKLIAVVRIRGNVNIRKEIRDTLGMLKLNGSNYCVVVPYSESLIGMVRKVKDYVTYGEIDDETFRELVEKRGEEYKGREKDARGKIGYSSRFMVFNNKKYKKYFRLNSPKSGFERKGIKTSFRKGGALGNRGIKINGLIKRML
jgi:large subunit ribosomal protein L30